mmetsp:Transcript_38421/g.101930  ORF Transcript_38421/g.101930 Transcript_38421/m.101930 type:complete len:258 (-) Transcript_38421:727-1500(-)
MASLILVTVAEIWSRLTALAWFAVAAAADTSSSLPCRSLAPRTPLDSSRCARKAAWSVMRARSISSVRSRTPFSAVTDASSAFSRLYSRTFSLSLLAYSLKSSPLRIRTPPAAPLFSRFSLSSMSSSRSSSLRFCSRSRASCFLRATTAACWRYMPSLSSAGLRSFACRAASSEMVASSRWIRPCRSWMWDSSMDGSSRMLWICLRRDCFCWMSAGSFSMHNIRVICTSSSRIRSRSSPLPWCEAAWTSCSFFLDWK